MIRKSLFFLLAIILLSSTVVSAADVFGGSDVKTAVMGNGLKVITLEDHSTDLVAVDVWVKTGVISETAKNNGVSHFIEHILFKRTAKRGPGEVDRDIESVGATLDANTSRDWTHFHTVVAKQFLPTAMEILADVLTHPAFDIDDIERERSVILDEIARSDSDYQQVAMNALFANAFKNHPYGFPEEGTPENVKKLSKKEIQDYYNTYYVPNNMSVVIVGDISAEDAVSAVGLAFQGFKKKDVPKLSVSPEPAPTGVVRKKIEAKTTESHLAIGFRGPSVEDASEVYAADVLLCHLGLGYRSWLSTEIEEKQKLASETSADFLTQRDPGIISLYMTVKPGDLEKVEQAVMSKLKELKTKPLSDDDLSRAKRSLEGSYAFQNETFSSRANTLGFYDSIKDYTFATSYVEKIRSVKAEDIRALVEKYLDPDKAIIVEVGP